MIFIIIIIIISILFENCFALTFENEANRNVTTCIVVNQKQVICNGESFFKEQIDPKFGPMFVIISICCFPVVTEILKNSHISDSGETPEFHLDLSL
jgi:hypothetical protein